MGKPKFYFRNADDELCYQKEYFLSDMKDEGLKELELFLAKPIKDDEYFFCKAVDEMGTKGDCGKHCNAYEPKNRKSGCCRYKGKLYEPGEKVVIKIR